MLEGFRPDAAAGGQLIGQRDAPEALAPGRVCAEASCATVLSIYNPDAFCSVHNAFRSARRSRVRTRTESRPSRSRPQKLAS